MTNDEQDPRHDEAAALALIKAMHAKDGRVLTRDEAVEFITMPIYFGAVRRVPKPKRGPWSLDTQYTLAYERRKGLYARLVRNILSGQAARTKTQPMRAAIEFEATALLQRIAWHRATDRQRFDGVTPHAIARAGLVTEIMRRVALRGMHPSRSTVQRVVRALGQ